MKKSWLVISLWFLIVLAVISWSSRAYPFTPTFPYYQITSHLPKVIATLGNFDGVNYLRLAELGYPSGGGEVAFFPLYPVLIRGLSNLGLDPLLSALSINVFCLIIFFVIIRELYSKNFNRFLLLFLTFPTSFFLLSAYSESLFLLLLVLVLFFMKRQQFLFAALTLALLSSVRLVGVGAIIYLVYGLYRTKAPIFKYIFLLLISFSGLLLYMLYLYNLTGDPLAFIHVQPQFGMGRSGGELILLPQVLYRYLKMLATISFHELIYWRVLWELLTFIFFAGVIVKYWRKLTPPDLLYSSFVVLLPSLSGTLSSFPRYALVTLPLFLVVAKHLKPRYLYFISILQAIILVCNLILFTRGLFVS